MAAIDYTGKDPQTGQFLPNNKRAVGSVGGGNPNPKRMAGLKRAFLECGSEADVRELYALLMKAARDGDIQATKLLLDHLVGRPTHQVEVTGLDGDPVKVDMATMTSVILGVLGDDPEKQYKMAAALRQLGQSAAIPSEVPTDGRGNGAGSEG